MLQIYCYCLHSVQMHDDAKETHPSCFAQTAQILTMRSIWQLVFSAQSISCMVSPIFSLFSGRDMGSVREADMGCYTQRFSYSSGTVVEPMIKLFHSAFPGRHFPLCLGVQSCSLIAHILCKLYFMKSAREQDIKLFRGIANNSDLYSWGTEFCSWNWRIFKFEFRMLQ